MDRRELLDRQILVVVLAKEQALLASRRITQVAASLVKDLEHQHLRSEMANLLSLGLVLQGAVSLVKTNPLVVACLALLRALELVVVFLALQTIQAEALAPTLRIPTQVSVQVEVFSGNRTTVSSQSRSLVAAPLVLVEDSGQVAPRLGRTLQIPTLAVVCLAANSQTRLVNRSNSRIRLASVPLVNPKTKPILLQDLAHLANPSSKIRSLVAYSEVSQLQTLEVAFLAIQGITTSNRIQVGGYLAKIRITIKIRPTHCSISQRRQAASSIHLIRIPPTQAEAFSRALVTIMPLRVSKIRAVDSSAVLAITNSRSQACLPILNPTQEGDYLVI